ncbi:helix-turn-helix domain-containing protein [Streptosporangium sandarakinum]|uniref:helix-turn-helix domain-containing protein n=1 Tax=Streptosporangium sandarakinum TaxID=1260955 RepID=UPI003F4D5DD5
MRITWAPDRMRDMARIVKRVYRYRFHPTPEQADELARTFGCVRYVYKALRSGPRDQPQSNPV